MNFTAENKTERAIQRIVYALYLYGLLLIFEGALRRWILPGLSGPLLLVRDPVAIYILFLSWKYHVLKVSRYLVSILVISAIAFYTAMFLGHGNIYVALYGLRITVLHFPLLFVIQAVFNKKNIETISRWMIVLSIPMLLLIVIQFYSPQTSWINKGLGDNSEGGGFVGAMGYFRPPGTFSFTNGLVLFFTVVSSFIFWGLSGELKISKWILYSALACLFLSIPFSISRTLLFSILITMFFFIFSLLSNKLLFWRTVVAGILLLFLFYFFINTDLLSTGLDVFQERFQSANESEGGLEGVMFKRFLGSMGNAFENLGDLPFWGHGVGMGTNAASQITTGQREFLLSEGEWGRVLGELGPLLGVCFLMIRVFIAVKMIHLAFQNFRGGYFLPWLLVGNTIFNVVLGQWAQPTYLGFTVFFGGILLAASKSTGESLFPEV